MILDFIHGFLFSPVVPEGEMFLGLYSASSEEKFLKDKGLLTPSVLEMPIKAEHSADPPYQLGTACVEDKQILARQERGVPLGFVTSPALFPGLSSRSHIADAMAL